MFEIFCHMFDRSFASAVVNSALGTNIFYVPFVKINSRHPESSRCPGVKAFIFDGDLMRSPAMLNNFHSKPRLTKPIKDRSI